MHNGINRMVHLILGVGLAVLLLSSCASSRKIRQERVDKVVETAKTFQGTPYRYGGTTRAGMDCSALVYLSFRSAGIRLPRVSEEQSRVGKRVSKRKLKEGDVVFFATGRRRRKVTHAGIVTERRSGTVYFIHASTSLGVTEDNIQSRYWSRRWVRARRMF
ncbi:C40 family peptidase [Cyclobacterium xiamenense]|jgi:cell wall-associated NlpC family hydrolase|uniref:C40 family peptidase n=1 Tax=Cyclobacterium xiamenense TaxID=1297121 RepID=UPI0035CEE1AC